MTWKAKQKPTVGCLRNKTRFLIFPKKIDGVWKWLEVATWVEKYKRHVYLDEVCGIPFEDYNFRWTPIMWCEKENEHNEP